jgi:guanosine-3',5'-bis(diphosphate) 3'-pyrophosphohydrolase
VRDMEKQTAPDLGEFVTLAKLTESDAGLVERAYRFAVGAHAAQKRLSGEPYIIHPLHVAKILHEMGFDSQVIAAALLHDTVEDTGVQLAEISLQFGKEIAALVDGVTKISRIRSENIKHRQAENIRKILFSMVGDIRVILIKLADKLHNMRTLEYMNREKAQSVARETLGIYAPIADRLGMARFKIELEDLALKHLDPGFYNDIKNYLMQSKSVREIYIEKVKEVLQREFKQYGVKAGITGRAKHLYSIYKKMKDKDKSLDEIFDLFAMRIVTRSVKECYEVLGIVHKLWMPFRGRFKDYIAMPKSNMYQSLHTTVIGPEGKTLEVQIRTEQMEIIAEEGISAHWAYKEGKKDLAGIEKELKWLKKLKTWKESMDNPSGFMEDLQKDLLEDEIYVFTPKGDVFELPIDSTPIDFAFKIHTEVGNHCIGAKVNDRIAPLRKPLHSGEVVSILTAKNSTPSLEWLDVVKTSRARHKIKAFFAAQEEKRDEEKREEEKLKTEQPGALQRETLPPPRGERKTEAGRYAAGEYSLIAEGEKNVQIRLAQCCTPHPGDAIIGYITRGKGITVHRVDCTNLKSIRDYSRRRITVEWEEKTRKIYTVNITSKDRSGLLMDITTAMANANANIVELHMKSSQGSTVKAVFRVQIKHEQQLKMFIKDIKSIPDIVSIDYR